MEPIRILNHQQMKMIDEAAHKILAQTGIKINCPEALSYMDKFGCKVDKDTHIAKIPQQISGQVVQKMRDDYLKPDRPERMPVRFSHVRFRPAPYKVHHDFTVNTGAFCCFIHDLDGNRRHANRHDMLCSINMANSLEQIDYMGLPVADQSVLPQHRPVVMAAELVKYTKKLGGIETFCKEDVAFIDEIAQIVAGSAEQFRKHPILVGYAEIRSPLCFDKNMAEIFIEYIKRGIPQTVDTMPSGGSTAPVTTAGILALGAAETIAAMILAYAIRDDAVVAMDITPSYCDMSSGLYKYSGADRCNLLTARVQLLAEYYGCPTGVHGGKTDCCYYNEQTGVEKISTMMLTILAGAVGIGTIGHLENTVTFSPLQLVIDNEIAHYVRRSIREPLVVDNETLATDVINTVGPGGNFLSQTHTAEHYRDELFLSPLFTAQPWEQAHNQTDNFDMTNKARAIAGELWHEPEQPVLSDEQIRQIDAVVKRATAN